MGGGAGGGAKAEQAAAVAGATPLAPVAVDGGLQLAGRTHGFACTLVWVQILHIPDKVKANKHYYYNNNNYNNNSVDNLIQLPESIH